MSGMGTPLPSEKNQSADYQAQAAYPDPLCLVCSQTTYANPLVVPDGDCS